MADVKGTCTSLLYIIPSQQYHRGSDVLEMVGIDRCPFLRLPGLNDNLGESLIQGSYLASSRPCPAPVSKRLVSHDWLPEGSACSVNYVPL